MIYLYHQRERKTPDIGGITMWCVVDMFGFAWGDLVDSLEEAQRQLKEIQEDSKRRGWDIDFEIERRD